MTEPERLRKLNQKQKELIALLQEGAKKDAEIIVLYQKLLTSSKGVIESLQKYIKLF